jgi:hypothetical protein
MRRWARLRTGATLAACAYAVHSLRYALAYGSHAGEELQRQGHAYLSAAPVVLTAVLALAAGELIRAAARGDEAPVATAPLRRTWLLGAMALLAIFSVQELLEGVLAAGHTSGVQALVGGGGWLAAPLAIVVGLVLALLQRGARRLLAAAGPRLGAPRPRPLAATLAPSTPRPAGRNLLGSWLRGRAPPALAG